MYKLQGQALPPVRRCKASAKPSPEPPKTCNHHRSGFQHAIFAQPPSSATTPLKSDFALNQFLFPNVYRPVRTAPRPNAPNSDGGIARRDSYNKAQP
jgi:hypothetical protein